MSETQPALTPEDAPPKDAVDEIEHEIAELVADHGSERAALRAVLIDMTALLLDADRSASRGFLRGAFSAGSRPRPADDEP